MRGSDGLKAAGMAAYILYMGFVLIGGARHPYFNWDMVPYIGAVKALHEKDPAVLQRTTFEELKALAPDWVYEQLVMPGKKDYRSIVAEDPKSFMQQLPFYTIKPLYIFLLDRLHAWSGLSVAEAIIFVSVFSTALTMVLIMLWRPKEMNMGLWLALLIPVCWAGGYPIQSLANMGTPDPLSVAMMAAAFTLLLVKQARDAALALMLVSIFVRSSNVVLILPLVACLALTGPQALRLTRKAALCWGAASLGCYALNSAIGQDYGWATLFYHSFVQIQNYPADPRPPLTVSLYLQAMQVAWQYVWDISHREKLFFLAAVLGGAAWRWIPQEKRFSSALLGVMACYMTGHFLLFPNVDERYFYFSYLLITYALADIAMAFWPRPRIES